MEKSEDEEGRWINRIKEGERRVTLYFFLGQPLRTTYREKYRYTVLTCSFSIATEIVNPYQLICQNMLLQVGGWEGDKCDKDTRNAAKHEKKRIVCVRRCRPEEYQNQRRTLRVSEVRLPKSIFHGSGRTSTLPFITMPCMVFLNTEMIFIVCKSC